MYSIRLKFEKETNLFSSNFQKKTVYVYSIRLRLLEGSRCVQPKLQKEAMRIQLKFQKKGTYIYIYMYMFGFQM